MKSLETTVDIDAPAIVVWNVLTDFASYRRDGWNSYITSIEATLERGRRVTAVTKSPLLPQRDLKARIVSGQFPELIWEAKLPVPGIIHATHYFRIEPTSELTSRFVQGETLTGLLAAAMFPLVEKSEPGFVILNQALKQRAEARVHRPA